jgi:hypothetical protein
MSARAPRLQQPAPGDRAIGALEALLAVQRQAMAAGDLPALEQSHARIHAMLSDAGWRRDAARTRSTTRLRTALKAAALNAGLAARGEAHAARTLSALGVSPGLYGARGSFAAGAPGGPSRGLSA